jgi:SNF2 family DNA or RNA helicase
MKRFLLGDDTGLGKTAQGISTLCYIWEKDPTVKVVVFTNKSAVRQWANEFEKFTNGVTTFLCKGTPAQRTKIRQAFETYCDGPSVLIMGYRTAVQDFTYLQDWEHMTLIYDEACAFKSPKSQVHKVCRFLSLKAERVWGMTATLIKNNLMEGYGIYQVIEPRLFPMSYQAFMIYYAIIHMIPVKGGRKIPQIVGYSNLRIKEFRDAIDPFFIGRPKHLVASDLPTLIQQYVEVELSDFQDTKYAEALSGLLETGTGDTVDFKEVSKLTAIAYCQQIVNDLGLIDIPGNESPKLDALVELLTSDELSDEKIIVFSRFRRMIDIIMPHLAKNKIKAVRVTGSENEDQRNVAMNAFQDPKSDVRVICLTAAGTEAINLQAAKALICFDTPWSAGDFIQLVGRMIRIGSIHDTCYVMHLLTKRVSGKKTIDHRVMEVLSKKMTLVEAVLGKRLKGVEDSVSVSVENEISDLYNFLREDAVADDRK